MSNFKNDDQLERAANASSGSSFSRKKFLQYAGASAMAATTFGLVGCGDEGPVAPPNPNPQPEAVNLGSGDLGILNYAYALEQLEAAFYVQVMSSPYSGMTDAEARVLADVRDHEVAHRDWFNAAISSVAPDGIIPGLTPTFEEAGVDFSSRTSVLNTAMAFEDLGVSAYNGAGKLITDTNYLIQAGKIVSVEARHAAAIRSLINPGTASFAGDDIVDANGLDTQNSPADVLSVASGFIMESIDFSGLPTG